MPLAKVPANAPLYYEIELLRCQQDSGGGPKVCCDEAHFPCTKPELADLEEEEEGTMPLTA